MLEFDLCWPPLNAVFLMNYSKRSLSIWHEKIQARQYSLMNSAGGIKWVSIKPFFQNLGVTSKARKGSCYKIDTMRIKTLGFWVQDVGTSDIVQRLKCPWVQKFNCAKLRWFCIGRKVLWCKYLWVQMSNGKIILGCRNMLECNRLVIKYPMVQIS